MNIILLHPDDLRIPSKVRLEGRRFGHIMAVHRAEIGKTLKVGLLGGLMGQGVVTSLGEDFLELAINLQEAPPKKLPLTLLLALPRPKVLNRVIASATSLGVARIVLINAWKVEKAYWKSPRMLEENLLEQRLLGLEQAKDTVIPEIIQARLFKPFVDKELPGLCANSRCLLAHPGADVPCPSQMNEPITLAIGPEGGWIDPELESLQKAGFLPVELGPRILRTETAVASLIGRLFS